MGLQTSGAAWSFILALLLITRRTKQATCHDADPRNNLGSWRDL
jgi:hypothetical protein